MAKIIRTLVLLTMLCLASSALAGRKSLVPGSKDGHYERDPGSSHSHYVNLNTGNHYRDRAHGVPY